MLAAYMTLNRFGVHEHHFDAHRKPVFDVGKTGRKPNR